MKTQFDIYFQGVNIGSFEGSVANGVFRFSDPAAVAAALGAKVKQSEALRLMSESLNSNEALRCVGSQQENCDLLPAGVSGVIVNPETFRVDIFLGGEFLIQTRPGPTVLPNPISGPSLIQGVMLNTATDVLQRGQTHIGATFDTDASFGRAAVLSQVSGDDLTGFQLQQAYGQYVRNNWLGSAGLLISQNQTTLTNFRYYGADISSYQTSTVNNPNQGTPIQVLLPRSARVELYANGTLASTRPYDGGLQLLDTSALPVGSYNVRIIARDGATVVLDTTRPFTKAPSLPPAGKILFDFSVGERVGDFFSSPTGSTPLGAGVATTEFLPQTTGELVARAQVSRRIGASSAVTGDLMMVGSTVYPELTLQTYRGPLSALVGGSADSRGDYAMLVSGSAIIHNVSLTVSGRYTDANAALANATTAAQQDKYLPFSQTGYDLYGSATIPMFKGTLSLSGSYDHIITTPLTPDTFTYGVEYDRPVKFTQFGTDGLFSLYADWSDDEKLVGLKFTFYRTLGPNTGLAYDVGAEYAKGSDPTAIKTGGAPVVDAELEHTSTIGRTDLASTLSGSTDSQQHSLGAQVQATSPWGTGQFSAAYQDNEIGGSSAPLTLQLQTGFVLGGGQMQLGLPNPGPAMVLAVIDRPPATLAPASTDQPSSVAPAAPGSRAALTGLAPETVAAGSYRVVIDNQPYNLIDVGQKVAIPLQPYKDYRISLQAVGAPPYDFDLTPRDVPAYPGNVIVLHWKAKHVVTIYGRLVDATGHALAQARVDIGTDTTVTDQAGYFVITGPNDANVVGRTDGGQACKPVPLSSLKGLADANGLMKVGDVACRTN